MRLSEVARMLGTKVAAPDVDVRGYSIDSRTAREGDLFFAVEGERFDGHDFVAAALERGCASAVVSRVPEGADRSRLLLVKDVLDAMQGLARDLLRAWGGPVVGVTGSAGKTTTKDLTARVLEADGKTHKSVGNFNNAFGLPKSVLEMVSDGRSMRDYTYCVLEMGMSTPGEIARLTEIAPPEVGIVTLVAPAHIEFFEDGIEGVARAKAELVEGIVPGGTAVLNGDDPRVRRMADLRGDVRPIRFSLDGEGDVLASDVRPDGLAGTVFKMRTPAGTTEIRLPLVGRHNVANALAAAAAGVALGLDLDAIRGALASAAPSSMRGEFVRLANGATLVDDSYNSNPGSLEAMVRALAGLEGVRRRMLVAGEMLELGADAEQLHRDAGRMIAGAGVDRLVGVRGNARAMVEAAREAGIAAAEYVETPEEAAELVAADVGDGDVVLVKGSRGVRTDLAVAALRERFGEEGAG